jgi:hypothetical protein
LLEDLRPADAARSCHQVLDENLDNTVAWLERAAAAAVGDASTARLVAMFRLARFAWLVLKLCGELPGPEPDDDVARRYEAERMALPPDKADFARNLAAVSGATKAKICAPLLRDTLRQAEVAELANLEDVQDELATAQSAARLFTWLTMAGALRCLLMLAVADDAPVSATLH